MKLTIFLLLGFALSACQSTQERQTKRLNRLQAVVAHYVFSKGTFPRTTNDIAAYARESGEQINLRAFRRVAFDATKNGNLHVTYELAAPPHKSGEWFLKFQMFRGASDGSFSAIAKPGKPLVPTGATREIKTDYRHPVPGL